MSAQTLNIIYDTNYTSIINGWGFVNHQFSVSESKKWWLFGSLFWWNSNSSNQQTTTNQQTNTQNQSAQQWNKTPGFFDLLFGPLNSNQKTNTPTAQNQSQQANISTTAQNVQWWNPTETKDETTPQNQTVPETQASKEAEQNPQKKKKSWIDSMLDSVFWTDDWSKKNKKSDNSQKDSSNSSEPSEEDQKKLSEQERKANELREQIRKVLEIPDSEYKDSMITSDMRRFIKKVDEEYTANIADFKSHIAPSYWEYKSNLMNISGILWKTYYTQRYPTYIDALWTRDLMTMHAKWDMSFFIYPEDDTAMQAMLKRKSTQLKAELNEAIWKWITTDKEVEQQYRDVELIREKLSTREERYFELSNYFTIYNTDETTLREDGKKFEQKVSGYWIAVKNAIQRMDEWMTSTLPLCIDDLGITRSAVTSSLAGSFPFISNDLVQNTGIFYGLNLHTWWLVIMDRFNNRLPNMNSVILATSWAWKSFTVKLEILRYLMNWIDIIVIDH